MVQVCLEFTMFRGVQNAELEGWSKARCAPCAKYQVAPARLSVGCYWLPRTQDQFVRASNPNCYGHVMVSFQP